MLTAHTEKIATRTLSVGSFLTTIFLLTGVVTDPVNVTKHFILGATAICSIFAIGISGLRLNWKESRLFLLFAGLFLFFSIISVIKSVAPLSQNIYGSYGRNTGLTAYVFLILISLSIATLRRKESFQKVIYALMAAGMVNILYCLWAWQFGDFIGWSNPYNTILGTFGNPNFIGAFLGIFLSVIFAAAVQPNFNWKLRVLCLIIIVLGFFEIRYSHAVQGIVVTGAGFSLVIFFLLRNKFQSWIIPAFYSAFVVACGFLALLGALQKGPLSQYIYKTSVSLRGEYWQAGINMANKFPLTGVGMDSYGDWYRGLRADSALIMPGPSTVSNAAHNVNIDILAYGGWPLFLAYFAMMVLIIIAILRVTFRSKKYDPIFISLSVGWICYQIQAAISINQIGLAIWGWLLGGSLIAYEIATRDTAVIENISTGKKIKKNSSAGGNTIISPELLAGVGLVVGALIAVPPLSADMKWRSAVTSGNVEKVKLALEPSYLNPQNSFRYASAVQIFEQNSLFDLAHEYALNAVAFNPNHFDSWRMFYAIKNASDAERATALVNLKRLDPKNPDVLAVRK